MTTKHVTETLLEDEKHRILREFASIYGIGPMTAQMLYVHGCRTLEDAKKFYEDPENASQQQCSEDEDDEYEDKNKRVPESWIGVSLSLKDDLSVK